MHSNCAISILYRKAKILLGFCSRLNNGLQEMSMSLSLVLWMVTFHGERELFKDLGMGRESWITQVGPR